ncbi:MAG: hypothetical protein B7Z66_05905 [Chromatiales bacterium 21-64-14]|nr:MAG: hypothetical protein B7Z66_05905 [Chromatiales bacterium 21-64-14]HQU15162.1 translocation/assembly module TamB domain-containing protein [Gammaproteobacteria bacterium]
MKRRVFGITLLATLVGALAGAGFLVSTAAGARWSLRLAAALLPGHLQVGAVSGRLLGPLELREVRYRHGQTSVTLARMELDWRPRALFQETIHITRLRLDGLALHLTPGSAPSGAGPVRLPEAIRLPANVMVDEFRLRSMTLSRGSGVPYRLNDLVLQGKADRDRVRITRLDLDTPQGRAHLDGTIALRRPYPVDLRMNWTVRPPGGRTPVQGAGRVQGTLRRIELRQRITVPFRAELRGTWNTPLRGGRWQAHLRLAGFPIRWWQPNWPQVKVSGTLQTQGRASEFRAEGSIAATLAASQTLQAQLQISHQATGWQVEDLTVSGPGGLRAAATGRWHGGLSAGTGKLDAHWTKLHWPLSGAPRFTSPQGTLNAAGTLAAYRLRFNAAVGGAGIPPGTWRGQSQGDHNGVTFETLEGNVLNGTITGSGAATWRPQPSWHLTLRASHLNPGVRWRDWPGTLDGTIAATGSQRAGGVHSELRIDALRGELRGYPVHGQGRLVLQGHDARVAQLTLDSGDARLQLSGSVGRVWDLDWKLHAPHLGALVPDGTGRFTADGRLTGPRDAPMFSASIRAKSVRIPDFGMQALQAHLRIGTQGTQPVETALTAQGLRIGTLRVEHLEITSHGTARHHTLEARVDSSHARLRLMVTGGRAADGWQGALRRAEVAPTQGPPWRLRAPVPVRVRGHGVDIGMACWEAGNAQLCGALDWRRHSAWQGTLRAQRFPLGALDALLPGTSAVSGTLNLNATVGAAANAPVTGQAQLEAGPGVLRYHLSGGGAGQTAYRSLQAQIRLAQGAAQGQVQLNLNAADRLEAHLQMAAGTPGSTWRQRPIHGELHGRLRELAWLGMLFPEIQHVAGRFTLDLTVAGTPARPILSGSGILADGTAEIPRLGLQLSAVQIAARSQGSNGLDLNASAKSGTGTLNLTGTARPGPRAVWKTHLQVTGSGFQAANIPVARVSVSPKLDIVTEGHDLRVSGDVTVPTASLNLHTSQRVVRTSPDVVIVNAGPRQVTKSPWRVSARVRLILGDKVRLRGYGFKGRITGQVLAIDEPGKVTLGQGELRVAEGTYKAYGQDLKITQGRLLFAGGPIQNPGLDVESTRQVGDVTAGIRVRGTVQKPVLSLFSNPTMDQSDILSYLLIGRPISQASSSQGALLYRAASSVGFSGGNLLLGQLGSKFGLQEAQIESESLPGSTPVTSTPGIPPTSTATTPVASLVLGRYLSPRLYVQYTTALFQPGNIFRVRYKLSTRWSVETETGIESGIDFLYTIER